MHKEEASKLFGELSKAPSVKITKLLYNNDHLYLKDLLDAFEGEDIVLADYLIPLIKCSIVLKESDGVETYFVCNKALIDELMGFFKQKCHCCCKEEK